ncbi:hypothetical protein [Halococcus saccharolyticus]|uniref:Uncharacterized protein n=1 Tax=Halococcus saccharolyticus DSM 5350 TaxID=1227455 RepID=M0MRE3_9EURY|nr:hypothetical protein [Halococcus saccharolyticus]EMA47933.1 hypothetical protein C449_00635 [Halococcus saccharolyticus DSM 5350]
MGDSARCLDHDHGRDHYSDCPNCELKAENNALRRESREREQDLARLERRVEALERAVERLEADGGVVADGSGVEVAIDG